MKTFIISFKGPAIAAAMVLGACNKAPVAHEAGHEHGGGELATGICPEHDLPAGECGICRPEKIPGLKVGESLKLRLASDESAAMADIGTVKASQGGAAEGIDCYAELGFAGNRYARISAPVGGVVREVLVEPGGKVAAGQAVARIWSAGVAEAVAKAVLTHQTLGRERKLRDQRVTSEKDLQEAEASHRAACQAMRTLGFTEARIDELAARPEDVILLDARAPFAGEITAGTAVRGAMVEAGAPMFTLADRAVMWADLALPENSLELLRMGQDVELRIESLPDRAFTGKLTWISAELDERTRMVRARAEMPNPDGLLKARMFARARVITRMDASAVLVPTAAIQRIDGKPFLFVREGVDLFDARAVLPGAASGDHTIIAEGLKAGEEVAVRHAFALRSQLLISRLGAGCADD